MNALALAAHKPDPPRRAKLGEVGVGVESRAISDPEGIRRIEASGGRRSEGRRLQAKARQVAVARGDRLARGLTYSAMDRGADFGYSPARISIVVWAMTALCRA